MISAVRVSEQVGDITGIVRPSGFFGANLPKKIIKFKRLERNFSVFQNSRLKWDDWHVGMAIESRCRDKCRREDIFGAASSRVPGSL